ncbi:MAG: hydrogenase nickel incorporation protein HypB [Kiritimatiellae bacterium]|nr:hydrogenase nickel incorporation protein HypB [Kiritimatiellia bacterium]
MCEKCGCSRNVPARSGVASDHDHGAEHVHEDAGLSYQDRLAERNRGYFRAKRVFVVNLLSFAGSGVRPLVERTLKEYGSRVRAVTLTPEALAGMHADHEHHEAPAAAEADGDVAGNLHMDAHRVAHALDHLDLDNARLLLIVNGGSAACQAVFDLGENVSVALFSVRDGAFKPLKFPLLFGRAAAVVINETDAAAEAGFDMAQAHAHIGQVAPAARILELSPATGAGMRDWYEFLNDGVQSLNK